MPERVYQRFEDRDDTRPTKKPRVSYAQPPHSRSGQVHGPSSLKYGAQALLSFRKTLPIASHEAEIRSILRKKDLMLLIGETGSGKSTQVPQFLVGEEWCRSSNNSVGGCIAITEPRRIATINLARRVAREMNTPLGSASPASKVGYSVRFDNCTSPSTQIKYLTEGMLLQELLRDPWLKAYSAVIVDEVHERSVNVDLILGFLRQMIIDKYDGRGGIPLKIVIMSATAEMERLKAFFEEAYLARKEIQMDSDLESSEWSGLEDNNDPMDTQPQSPVAVCRYEGRQFPVNIKYTPKAVQNIADAALLAVFQINYKEPMPGDVLVFMTGQDSVELLEKLIKQQAQNLGSDVPKLLVLPLFAALPAAAQQQVFEPAPPKTRKVIIATNIAETSVTVSGVRYVVDGGKAKVRYFRSTIGLEALLSKPISKSAAIQRKGRAGREGPGVCYRLYTEADYFKMKDANTPEILRCDLTVPILIMKARSVDNIIQFPLLDQPPHHTFVKACENLFQLGALDESGNLSSIGKRMAGLPLSAPLARVLIAAEESNCAAEVIDIISCLSVESIFLNLVSEEKKEEAEIARRALYRREGDHLTFLKTVQAYAAENADRKAWCHHHFVSHRAMKAVMDTRKQLRQRSKAVTAAAVNDDVNDLTPELGVSILKCFLKGFGTSTARAYPDGSYKTVVGNEVVTIHPSSVLFGRQVEAFVYSEFVFTTKNYARGVSAVEMGWIGEAFGV